MITKTDKVRFAIASCEMCFIAMGKDMWTPNEYVEELWLRVDEQLEKVEEAERREDDFEVHQRFQHILRLLNRIEEEVSQ
ncbi:MAG: hypothetical protein NT023_02420 [Armatimonadetes bacterium]|nr:hypothetical protein [Armatimonadota bacterium]